ncbi:molybdopterin cofactor-binding domain-containing protein [Palleronia sp. LCG004]|uniref:molybdopterin cofactor-binding domain-containing protein n=1 Tax=Palleronia sp. LCG004 TaxID=3079304 RepID=UPI0029427DF0|nr:molybdopterin cofactor-binding domain-containing protein [Palleronia sp. LCG004]WOI57883.1 molybdopterin cofactor-binding domain-containing protein [Palleronia sp. LCG004]
MKIPKTSSAPAAGGALVAMGCSSVEGYFTHLRQAGAQAPDTDPDRRRASGCPCQRGHDPARHGAPRPHRTIAGTEVERLDIPDKTTGTPVSAIDVDLPDTVHPALLLSPVKGETPIPNSAAAARAIDVIVMDHAAAVDADGRGADVWLGTQSQTISIMIAAAVLGTTPDRIRFHAMQMGGGFGCRTVATRKQRPRHRHSSSGPSRQDEGGITFGLSSVLRERSTFTAGQIEKTNFYNQVPIRISDIPEIEVQFVGSGEPPSGGGEIGVPMTAPAIANALSALTNEPQRQLPFSMERQARVVGETTDPPLFRHPHFERSVQQGRRPDTSHRSRPTWRSARSAPDLLVGCGPDNTP